jgi:DNA-binding XRE family transcriptional regulator
MYIYFDKKTDYAEIFFEKKANYLSTTDDDEVCQFMAEDNHQCVGYSVENITSKLKDLNFLNPFQKLSILIKTSRLKKGFTQEEMAEKMDISLLPYQRLESGENNPTFRTLLKLKEVLPSFNFDDVI